MQQLSISNSDVIKSEIQQYFSKNEEARFIHRLHAILLLADNPENNCKMVSSLFGNANSTLVNWVNRLNKSGTVESLRSVKNTGRPPKLSTEQKEEIKKNLQEPPEKVGISTNIWDGKTLSHHIKTKYDVELKTRACQHLFKELGFTLKRARPMVAKGNPVKKEEFKKTKRKT